MQTFTGMEYLMIDCANHYGLDKELFETRIQWVKEHLDSLESYAMAADKKPLFVKALKAIRKVQVGMPTGHLVGFDATCSGIQIMSTLTGCKAGAEATGLVDPNKRADAYTACTKLMNEILGGTVNISRKQAKTALMTSFYGSKEQPIRLFGEDTAELAAFYAAAAKLAPGAWELLQDLLASWQPFAKSHEWQLPDGFEAKVKVMKPIETRIEVQELDGASFTYQYYINEGTEKGLSNAANVTHSVDAYVLRCIHRRCNYDREMVQAAHGLLVQALEKPELAKPSKDIEYYKDLYQRSGMADVVILPHLNSENVHGLTHQHIEELLSIVESMLVHKPFDVITIHDEFKCHPNHMNHLRQHYINIFAELADSKVLEMILGDIYGAEGGTYTKLSDDLSTLIRGSNYALC